MKPSPTIEISRYNPGRFAYLMHKPFAAEAWNLLASEEGIRAMLAATEAGKPAISPLLEEIELRFETPLSSPEYPPEDVAVLFNNMIKQILELHGHEHIACGFCPNARFIRKSGMYGKKGLNLTEVKD